jgi:hypothetical protein
MAQRMEALQREIDEENRTREKEERERVEHEELERERVKKEKMEREIREHRLAYEANQTAQTGKTVSFFIKVSGLGNKKIKPKLFRQ